MLLEQFLTICLGFRTVGSEISENDENINPCESKALGMMYSLVYSSVDFYSIHVVQHITTGSFIDSFSSEYCS